MSDLSKRNFVQNSSNPKMSTNQIKSLTGIKSVPTVDLNHHSFSGSKDKPSRDDIYKKILIPKAKFQQKGLIFVWPQKRPSFFYTKELIWLTWIVAHALYWLHVIDILPTGTAVPLKQPPWRYEAPLHRPKSRDYIIEPDWESHDYATLDAH